MDFAKYIENRSLKKVPKVGVHFEQKITPDLFWCVAFVILDLTKSNHELIFTDQDIRTSSTYITLMRDYFSKAPQENAEGEFNKVSRYQLEVMVYAGLLNKNNVRPSRYSINQLEILQYIAQNDFSASHFLTAYVDKFIADNGLSDVFEAYHKDPTQDKYEYIKQAYLQWARINTNIKGANKDHTNRVINKIFNLYCCAHNIPGEDGSRVKSSPCPYSYLIYKRTNFRDVDLPRGMTRSEYKQFLTEQLATVDQEGVLDSFMKKAKDEVKKKYNMDSEIEDIAWGYAPDRVVEAHHILPRRSYPQFAASKENLISLTPDQHRSLAHVGKYNGPLDPIFQTVCLQVKLDHIVESLTSDEDFYSYRNFVSMVNAIYGWQLTEDTAANILADMLNDRLKVLQPQLA